MKQSHILLLFLSFCSTLAVAQPLGTEDNHLKIDQFGYRPTAQKICIISNPQTGYNSNLPFTNPSSTYEVRRWSDNTVAFSGAIAAWNGGATHAQSGDKVWWFDFSSLQDTGTYYVYDPVKLKRSYKFQVNDLIYKNVLKQAVRSYYYQRCGHAKATPHAQSPWTDAVCHQHAEQDLDCRLVSNPVASTSKNLKGGWHDAGDYNKYTNFTFSTLTDLLLAYEENPAAWTDDFGLPESGNGKPDLLDEVKYELDWLRRMQNTNGSVLSKVSVTDFSATTPPSADSGFRRYGAESTSATLTGAAVFALAALQYQGITGWTAYADSLKTAAINAWNWAAANPSVIFTNAGFSSANPEVADYDRTARKLCAAAYLYALTGNSAYKTFFDANYTSSHMMQWGYVYPFEDPYQDGLLYYTKNVNATASVKSTIQSTYISSVQTNNADNLPAFLNNADAYRAFLSDQNTTWGSNQFRSTQANIFYRMNVYGLNSANASNYAKAGQAIINWMHGVNPTAYCFLSNMGAHGAEFSIPEFYHSWFANGSPLDQNPAPGFLPGGPNPSFAPDPACACTIAPPQNQPVQKSFKAWNTSWPENSWEITENAIYSEAAYVRALSKNVSGGTPPPPPPPPSYCVAKGVNNSLEWIDLISFNGVNRSSAAEPGGYVNTGLTGTMTRGVSNSVTYSAGFSGSSYTERWACFIDYNHNYIFETSERVFSKNRSGAGNFTNTFTVPNTAQLGPTRLRMIMSRNTTPTGCGNYAFGEVEDYTVNIIQAITGGGAEQVGSLTPQSAVAIFPNPTSSELYFASETQLVRSVWVVAATGVLVKTKVNVDTKNGSISTEGLLQGTYILCLEMEGGEQVRQRFLKL